MLSPKQFKHITHEVVVQLFWGYIRLRKLECLRCRSTMGRIFLNEERRRIPVRWAKCKRQKVK